MRHAYLMLVHNQFDILKCLIRMLDSESNDIYIHIDRKAKDFPFQGIKSEAKKSNVIFLEKRHSISWGGDSQIKSELALLKKATVSQYDYYHFISGVDLPIKSQEYIYDFFERNNGKNFLDYETDEISYQFAQDRMEYRHLLQNYIPLVNGKIQNALYKLENKLILLQKGMKLSRLKECKYIIKKGASWFSITHEMALTVLKSENMIKKYFYKSLCADELFLPTIAYNSALKDTIVNNNLRYIIWNGGKNPKLLDLTDLPDMLTSTCLFARKFSKEHDMSVVLELEKLISRN